jgi:uncharacterized protein YidB (DUF937 family)
MGTLDSLMSKYGDDLNELVAKFESSGFGEKVQSWIGTGENETISPGEVKQALGQDEIDRLAQEAGVQPDEFADKVSRELPGAIDKATPQGVIPSVEKAATGAFNR